MNIYAIIPARSGSKGVKGKNIRMLAGAPLLAYSIGYAQQLGVDRVICSTDSAEFAAVAKKHGAEVPFLRSSNAASDTAMEDDILRDMRGRWAGSEVPEPDVLVWLRPTFVFRSVVAGRRCIERLLSSEGLTACRTVCESESRLYSVANGVLNSCFDDRGGRSMIRRQEVGQRYKVFSLDVFRYGNFTPYFLGDTIGAETVPKICGLDIDDEDDWRIVETLVKANPDFLKDFVHVAPEVRLKSA